MQHLFVALYQVWSYDAPKVKICPAPGVTNLNIGTKKNEKFFLSEPGGLELWFLAPLAIGQQAYVMTRCASIRPSVR